MREKVGRSYSQEINLGADYTPEETRWLAAVDAWKTRKGPVIRAAELLVLLSDLGYRNPSPPGVEAIDLALEAERRRLARQSGHRLRHLSACETLGVLVGMGYRREDGC